MDRVGANTIVKSRFLHEPHSSQTEVNLKSILNQFYQFQINFINPKSILSIPNQSCQFQISLVKSKSILSIINQSQVNHQSIPGQSPINPKSISNQSQINLQVHLLNPKSIILNQTQPPNQHRLILGLPSPLSPLPLPSPQPLPLTPFRPSRQLRSHIPASRLLCTSSDSASCILTGS